MGEGEGGVYFCGWLLPGDTVVVVDAVVVVVVAVITLTRCRDNQVRGNRTGSGNSGAEEYLKRTKTKKPKQVIHASFYG